VEIVRLRLEEYESVRTDATHFVIVPGHEWVVESTGTGHVIRTGDRFLVVAKTGRAAEVSEERDPRS
jgi:hypothetical protein